MFVQLFIEILKRSSFLLFIIKFSDLYKQYNQIKNHEFDNVLNCKNKLVFKENFKESKTFYLVIFKTYNYQI